MGTPKDRLDGLKVLIIDDTHEARLMLFWKQKGRGSRDIS
jgi:hypothetical protein